jgi:hypothetical protein
MPANQALSGTAALATDIVHMQALKFFLYSGHKHQGLQGDFVFCFTLIAKTFREYRHFLAKILIGLFAMNALKFGRTTLDMRSQTVGRKLYKRHGMSLD